MADPVYLKEGQANHPDHAALPARVSQDPKAALAGIPPFPTIPETPPSEAVPTAAFGGQKRKWLWPGTGVSLGLLGLVFWLNYHPEFEDPNLPEWFYRAHRIKANYLKPGIVMKDIGIVLPQKTQPSGQHTPEWLDEHFTHYLADDAFVWENPANKNLPDGKILRGLKVVHGKKYDFGKGKGVFSLICTRTPDNDVMNMYVSSQVLRERSKGPPAAKPPEDD